MSASVELADSSEAHVIQRGGHYSMQIFKAVCRCGWDTVQRDPRWVEQRVAEHLAATADSSEQDAAP